MFRKGFWFSTILIGSTLIVGVAHAAVPTVAIGSPSLSLTSSSAVSYDVTYTNATVVNLTAASTTLNGTGTATGTLSFTGGSSTVSSTVTISSITGDGTLGITILAGVASSTTDTSTSTTSGTFTVDNTKPTISIGAPSLSVTSSTNVTFAVTYTTASSTNLTTASTTFNSTGTATGTVTITGATNTTSSVVTISSITGNGSFSISIGAGVTKDQVGNQSTSTLASATSTVDNTPPTVAIGSPSLSLTSSTDVTYTVTYTGASSTRLIAASTTLNGTGTATGTITITGATNTTSSVVTISSITGDGTLGITVRAGVTADQYGNESTSTPASTTFTVSNSGPTVTSHTPTSGGSSDVGDNIVIVFSTQMNSSSLAFSTSPSFDYTATWSVGTTTVTLAHATNYSHAQAITASITAARDSNGNVLSGLPYSWSWTTGSTFGVAGGGGGGLPPYVAPITTTTLPITATSSVTVTITPSGVVAPGLNKNNAELQAVLSQLMAQLQTLIAKANQLGIKLPQGLIVSTFVHDLKFGAKHDDVKSVQAYLNDHGFPISPSGSGSKGHETSYFGSATMKALAAFQKSVGISPAVGYFGPTTRAYMNSHP